MVKGFDLGDLQWTQIIGGIIVGVLLGWFLKPSGSSTYIPSLPKTTFAVHNVMFYGQEGAICRSRQSEMGYGEWYCYPEKTIQEGGTCGYGYVVCECLKT